MLVIPNRNRRSERREATKAEILDAAWAQVRADGLAALSLRDVARAVGMQPPSLYGYFDSKNAIYDAMYAQGARAFVCAHQSAFSLSVKGQLLYYWLFKCVTVRSNTRQSLLLHCTALYCTVL